MRLLGLILNTAIKEAGEFRDVRLSKEDAENILKQLQEQEEQLDELMPPKKYIVCKACGHKLRNDWLWCPWCRWEIRSGYTAEELE